MRVLLPIVWMLMAGGCRQIFALPDPVVGQADARRDAPRFFDARRDGGGGGGNVCFGADPIVACVATAPTMPLELSGSIDTDSASLCEPEASVPDACVISATTLTITGTLTVIGSRMLVLVATDAIHVVGHLEVRGDRGSDLIAGSQITVTGTLDVRGAFDLDAPSVSTP